jgi:glycosyltransferase involved in cell wall biosynthesis
MKLGIVTDCIHTILEDGSIATENHILLRQFEALATYFDEVVILCPFTQHIPQMLCSSYRSTKFTFLPLPVRGGKGVKNKIELLKTIPIWYQKFKEINQLAEVLYLRFPNNLNIPGFFFFYFKRKKIFATYTGTWQNDKNVSLTYKFQKWLLRNFFKGNVFVYALSSKQKNIIPSFSPSYSEHEWDQEQYLMETKLQLLSSANENFSLKMITVGSFIWYKNQAFILKVLVKLKKANIRFKLLMVGSGPLEEAYSNFIALHQLQEQVEIVGKKNTEQLKNLYRWADIIVQAPIHEGFGKVPLEAMFFGAVPVISKTDMSDFFIEQNKRGYIFDQDDDDSLLAILNKIAEEPSILKEKMIAGREFVKNYTLESWASHYLSNLYNT